MNYEQNSELKDAALILENLIRYDKLFLSAAKKNSVKLMKQIMIKNNEVNVNYKCLNNRITPLIYACKSGYKDVVIFLLSCPNIKVNLIDKNGLSALCYAIINKNKDIVNLLLKHEEIDVKTEIKIGLFKGYKPINLARLFKK
jgi:ankyrin repeat protein